YAIVLFPARHRGEAWRLFAPDSGDDHLVYPPEARDYAISRRRAPRTSEDWETWMRLAGDPAAGSAMQAPPPWFLPPTGRAIAAGTAALSFPVARLGR